MRPLIHIGYPKCGSTWLQRHIFNNPKYGFIQPWDNHRGVLLDTFVNANMYRFDHEAARAAIAPGFDEAYARGLVPVISDETLAGDAIQRRYDGPELSKRLHAAFPEARVLIVIREQRAMAISMYKQYVYQGGRLSFEEFVGAGDEPVGWSPWYHANYMEFDASVGRYRDLFGPENVHVLPLEAINASNEAALQRIQRHNGIEPTPIDEHPRSNVGMRATATLFRRKTNGLLHPIRRKWNDHYTAKTMFAIARLLDRHTSKDMNKSIEEKWRAHADKIYQGLFNEGNRQVSEWTGEDLSQYGYEC